MNNTRIKLIIKTITRTICILGIFIFATNSEEVGNYNEYKGYMSGDLFYESPELTITESEIPVTKSETPIIKSEISSEPNFMDYEIPKYSGFKSYMSYKAITLKSSDQYKLQHENAYTGEYGIRKINDRFCVALGSHFGSEMGMEFDLILENGTIIPCILADQKADIHTDSQNIITVASNCMSEFIVDMNKLDPLSKKMGDMSYCNKNWDSPVVLVRVYR